MDGNGRWAERARPAAQRRPQAGVEAIRRVVEAAPEQGIGTLTLYAFSSRQLAAAEAEVAALMALLRRYLAAETVKLGESGVRLRVIGRRDRLPMVLAHAIGQAERETASGDRLNLRIAIDYSARAAILDAASRIARCGDLTPEDFARLVTRRRRAARRRPRHPHQRREAALRFPPVGERLRRTAFHRNDVAGLRGGAPCRGARLLPPPRAPVRRPPAPAEAA